jgi:hypothetical protein
MAENEIRNLNNLRSELSTLKTQMTIIHQKIKEMEKDIYIKCNHVWTIDRTNVGEHTEHVCVHCNMFKTG